MLVPRRVLFKLSLIIKNNERRKCFLTTTQTICTLDHNASEEKKRNMNMKQPTILDI